MLCTHSVWTVHMQCCSCVLTKNGVEWSCFPVTLFYSNCKLHFLIITSLVRSSILIRSGKLVQTAELIFLLLCSACLAFTHVMSNTANFSIVFFYVLRLQLKKKRCLLHALLSAVWLWVMRFSGLSCRCNRRLWRLGKITLQLLKMRPFGGIKHPKWCWYDFLVVFQFYPCHSPKWIQECGHLQKLIWASVKLYPNFATSVSTS